MEIFEKYLSQDMDALARKIGTKHLQSRCFRITTFCIRNIFYIYDYPKIIPIFEPEIKIAIKDDE